MSRTRPSPERIRLLLGVLGKEGTYRLVRELALQDSARKQLAASLGVRQPRISEMLRELELLGLIAKDRSGGLRLSCGPEVRGVLRAAGKLQQAISAGDDAEWSELEAELDRGDASASADPVD